MIYNSSLPNFPQAVRNIPSKTFNPKYSSHAVEASGNDRYGKINLPSTVTFSGKDIFEIEIENGRAIKFGIRVNYNEQYDLVLIVKEDSGIVKTVWLNDKSDNHQTLNKKRYS